MNKPPVEFNPLVSYFSNAYENLPTDISAAQFIASIKGNQHKKLVEEIRERFQRAISRGVPYAQAKRAVDSQKKKLPAVSFAGVLPMRDKKATPQFTGLLCADLDLLGDRLAEILATLRDDPHVYQLFRSPSDGIKAIYRVPICKNADEYKLAFAAVSARVQDLTGVEIDKLEDFTRLCFASHDPAAYLNPNAIELPVDFSQPAEEISPPSAEVKKSDRNPTPFSVESRRAIAERVVGAVEWQSDVLGDCHCPGEAYHTTGEKPHECQVHLDRVPTIHCVHKSCVSEVEKTNHELRSQIGKAEWTPEAAPRSNDVDIASEPRTGDLSEFDYANLLAAKLPPIKTVGSDWFVYSTGAWQKIHRATLRPIAQEILPPAIRTARREATLLDHLEGRCQVAPDAFRGFYRFGDAGEVLINAANGIVRVTANQSPELLPHADAHLFTHRTAAKFDPQASADLFKKILVELLPDELDRDLLQLCFGNMLLPDCRFEVALVCYGEAGGGKSTIAEPVSAALGSDLVARLSMSQICDSRSYHLPKLKFAAVNLGTELDVIAIDESANFKTIVSGEPVEARPIYGEPFTMQTACKLWFLANGLPRFKNGTEAELRRTRFIRFDRRPEVKDVTLKTRLLAERDGVFNFMLAGLQRLLTVPEIPLGGAESQSVHARFKISNDPLGTFVAQQCEFDADGRESISALKNAFNRFCETHGLPVEFGDWFIKRLYERFTNLKQIRASIGGERVRCVAGIQLKSALETD